MGGLSIFAEAASRFLSTPPVQVELEEAGVRFNLGPGGGEGGGGGHLLPFKPLQLQLVKRLLLEISTAHPFICGPGQE